jgi:hypothetical protein
METFVVRVWVPSDQNDGSPDGVLRGFLEHPRSEQSWKFAGADELVEHLSQANLVIADLEVDRTTALHKRG